MRYGFLYAYTYLCVNVFCAIVSLGFARNVTADMGTRPEVRCMRLILYTFAAYLGVDFLWELGESGLVPLLAGMQAAINVAACILICLIACWWALYAEMRLHRHLASMRGFQIVFVFPFAIMALLLVSSMVNNLSLASGDRLGSTWGDLYFIRFIVVVSYLALAAGHALVAIPRATSAKRGECLIILLFALALTFFAALDSLVPYLPFMSVGLMWTLIMVFVMLQRNRIFNDALTGLGNRRRMNEYLGKLLSGRREGGGHLLYMLDVNKFKRINDTYGHLEGDRALKLVALALRQTVDFYGGFAARWGGDEFVLVVPATDDVSKSPDAVPAFANERLARLAAEEDLPFDVAVSAGYTVIEASDAVPSDPIDRADRMLYDNKRALYARD